MIARSLLFYLLLSLWTIFMGIICLPLLFLPSIYLNKPIRLWIFVIFILLEYICKITHEIQGQENIPHKAVLVASKHQSAFETFALFYYLHKGVFIHKNQLFWIPIFGQYLKKINMISINRKGGASTMRLMLKETKKRIGLGFSIIIFPEGTRKIPGETPDYKTGFIGIYKEIKTAILPVAVNSGYCWPKNTFLKKKGHIIIKFLPLIMANLDRKKILHEVEKKIEEATNKII
jgi:1-acyl-sn-glycerol-3-phosphate acyltransferase